jgi:hypothetical protein
VLGLKPDDNLELSQVGLRALLEKRHFGSGKVQGDYVAFSCKSFTLNLVFYRADLWAEVHQNDHPDEAIALPNLLSFLSLSTADRNARPFPASGVDVSSWRLKRLSSIATDIDLHFDALNAFFCTGDLASKRDQVRKYVVARNPDLFRRRGDP